jgi:DNA mismatch repair protein MutL
MTHELQQALPDSPVETGPESQPTSVPPSSQTGLPIGRLSILRLIGQVAAAYLVAEGPDGLYLIDQHAAHERVLFERMVAQKDGNIPSQALLQSVPVELPAIAAQSIESQLDLLSRLGFDIQPFGPNTYLVRSVPAILSGIEPAAALRVLVEDFEEDESPLQAELEARVIARVCKRAAIKAGKIMTREEQARLLEDLENCRSPRTCPHGRPTMIHLSVEMLERQFGRRGPR